MATLTNNQHTKDPDATKPYSIDWTPFLAEGETLVASVWIVPTGLTAGVDTHDATSTTIWLAGGTERSRAYTVTNRITTSAGLIDDASIFITVGDE